nr:unnamed protein product [Callosobruchus analis]
MAESTVVPLGQMVDLALCNTDHGLVNFGLMHALLHAIINKLNLQDVNLEFIGKQAEEIQRYINAIGLSSDKIGSGIVTKTSKGSVSSGEVSVALTKESFEKLRKDVDKIKKRLGQLAGSSSDVAGATSESDQGQDSFQLIYVQQRLDSAEATLKKLCNLVQDLIKATGGDPEMIKQLEDVQKEATSGGMDGAVLKALERRLAALENAMALGGVPVPSEPLGGGKYPIFANGLELLGQNLQKLVPRLILQSSTSVQSLFRLPWRCSRRSWRR